MSIIVITIMVTIIIMMMMIIGGSWRAGNDFSRYVNCQLIKYDFNRGFNMGNDGHDKARSKTLLYTRILM